MKLYIFLICSNFFLGSLEILKNYYKKKDFKIVQYFYITLFFIMIAFNRDDNDYRNYYSFFYYGKNELDIGYRYLNLFLKKIGLNFSCIFIIIAILAVYVIFYKYKLNYKISFICMYSLYALSYDINQLRNFICILLIILGIYYLNKGKKKQYLIFNFIAIFFHKIAFLYFLYYFLQKLSLKKYVLIIFFMFIGSFCGVFIFKEICYLLFPIKANLYFSLKPNLGAFLYFILFFIDILFIILSLNMNKKSIYILKKNETYIKFILFIIPFLITSFLNLELISRLYRNIYFIKCFLFFKLIENTENIKNRIMFYIMVNLPYILLTVLTYIISYEKDFQVLLQISNIKFIFE